MKRADDAFFKMTKNKQRFKFDYREDGKLDVTFVRMDRKARKRWMECKLSRLLSNKKWF